MGPQEGAGLLRWEKSALLGDGKGGGKGRGHISFAGERAGLRTCQIVVATLEYDDKICTVIYQINSCFKTASDIM